MVMKAGGNPVRRFYTLAFDLVSDVMREVSQGAGAQVFLPATRRVWRKGLKMRV